MIFLFLIFARPFISSLAFPYLNTVYSALLLGFLIIWLIYKGIAKERIANLKIPLILLLFALFISTTMSTDKATSLKELYKYISGILIFLVAVSLKQEDRIRVIKTIVLAACLISLLAIYQYFLGFRHILEFLAKNKTLSATTPNSDYIHWRRVFFPFVTPNTLGGYLAMILPLILTLWSKERTKGLSPFLFFLIPVSLALLLTKSLGALVSIFFGLLIYFYLQGTLNRKRLLTLAGLIAIIGLIFVLRQASTKQHFLPTFSLVMRLNYWLDTLKIIRTSPWWGLGPGNFNLAASRYAHNSYLQIWAEMGILGIISIAWLIIAALKSAISNIQISADKTLIAGLVTANAVFLIHNLFDFTFFLPEVSLIWWIVLGLNFGFGA